MNLQVFDFVECSIKSFNLPEPIVEFGGRIVVEDQKRFCLRPLFSGKDFKSTDLVKEAGIDEIADISNLENFENESVGTAICLETLEHCKEPFAGIEELHRVLKPNGVLLVSTPFDLGTHNYPDDYFRFTVSGLNQLLKSFGHKFVFSVGQKKNPKTVFGIAKKNHDFCDGELEGFIHFFKESRKNAIKIYGFSFFNQLFYALSYFESPEKAEFFNYSLLKGEEK